MLVPFVVDRVRVRDVRVPCALLAYEWLTAGEVLQLEGWRATVDGVALWDRELDVELHGDPEFGRTAADLERLPVAHTHLRRRQRAFLRDETLAFTDDRAAEIAANLRARWAALVDAEPEATGAPFTLLPFELDLSRVFPEDVRPGRLATLRIELDASYPNGQRAVWFCERRIEWRGPAPSVAERASELGFTVRGVDLHVHAAGAPPCTDERCPELRHLGAFSADDLAAQQRALGLDCVPDLTPPADGFELWSGEYQVGQQREVADWVARLAAGERLPAWSGSDAHEEAFEFGATWALSRGREREALEWALSAGHTYVSNGPALLLEVEAAGTTSVMGDVVPVDVTGGAVSLRLTWDVGTAATRLVLFHGEVGAASERERVLEEAAVGTGSATITLTPPATASTWVRAYAEDSEGARSAYTNPIHFVPTN